MILFAFEDFTNMAHNLKNEVNDISWGNFSVQRFPNKEIVIIVKSKVKDKHCLILGSISPPAEYLMTALLLGHTLKKEGAKKVIAILPYLAYSRQDKNEIGESLTTAWAGEMLASSGVDLVLTFDVHSENVQKLFPIPLKSLSSAPIFASEINKLNLLDLTVIAPDDGAIERSQRLAQMLGIKLPVAFFQKERVNRVSHLALHGEVSTEAILVDDILDTGRTLISATERLKSLGVKKIYICVTHGLFTASKWRELFKLGVSKIYCTNTVPNSRKNLPKTVIKLSVIPELARAIRQLGKNIGPAKEGKFLKNQMR